jgi:hypothetical protein
LIIKAYPLSALQSRKSAMTSVDCSEVDAELRTEHDRVSETAGAAGLNDVLKVGLDEDGALAEVEAIRKFDDGLIILDTPVGTGLLSILLSSLLFFRTDRDG